MSVFNVNLGEDQKINLILGQQGENAVTSVVFDFSAWSTAFGSGTLSLSVQRPGDALPYAVVMTVSGTDATWEITDLDTAYKGTGEIQLKYTVGTKVKKSVVHKFTVYRSLGENGEYPSPGQTWQEEIEADIADVKSDLQDLQEEIEGGGTGMSEEFKQALHDILEKVAYIDEDGQDYLDALDSAMWPPADLVSISAVYTQSGTVYDTDTLDSLKSDLVVTAHMSDSTTQTVTTYTLSGTLTEGTSTITVSYGGKTTTFNVSVTHQEVPAGYTKYDYLTLNGLTPPAQAKTYGIWTDVQMSTDYMLEMKLYVPSGISSYSATPLFGTRNGSSGTKEYAIFYKYSNNQIGYWFDGTDSTNQPPAPSKGAVHTIKIQPVGVSETYPNAVTISIDGTDYDIGSTSTGKMFDSWFGIFTYAINSNMGIASGDVLYVGQQIGEILVTDSNGDAVYDFVPVKDSSDRYGFYEKINGNFYYNSTYATTGYIGGNWE